MAAMQCHGPAVGLGYETGHSMTRLKTLEYFKSRVRKLEVSAFDSAQMAAPQVEARLISDATTRRGNVPSYGEFGNVPINAQIEVTATGANINVNAPDWVLAKAEEKGQVDGWLGIVDATIQDIVGATP